MSSLLTNSVDAAVHEAAVLGKPQFRVRKVHSIVVRCDKESFERLKLLKSLWPRVICAQQSNIVNAALDVAMSKPPIKNGFRMRVDFDGTTLDRFVYLAKHWGNLTKTAQQHAIEHAMLVMGPK